MFSLASRSCFWDLHINRKNVHVTVSVHQYFWDVLIKPSRERKSLLGIWIWLKTGLFWLDHFNTRFKKFCYSVVDLLVCFRSLSCCITNTNQLSQVSGDKGPEIHLRYTLERSPVHHKANRERQSSFTFTVTPELDTRNALTRHKEYNLEFIVLLTKAQGIPNAAKPFFRVV